MKHIIVSLFLILLTGTYSKALERFDLVTTEELFELLQERIEGKNNFFLVNTLDTLIFNHHYIPGSVNIPWSKVDELSHLLPQDPNTLVVTYCMGYR